MIRQLGYISFTIKSINLHFDVNHFRDTFHIHNKNGNKTINCGVDIEYDNRTAIIKKQ